MLTLRRDSVPPRFENHSVWSGGRPRRPARARLAGGGRGGGPRWGRARGGAAQRGPRGLPALWPSVAFPLLRGCRFVFKVTLCARVIAHR